MKRLILLLIFLAGFTAQAQFPQPFYGGIKTDSIWAINDTVHVNDPFVYPDKIQQLETIADLENYTGESTTVFVKDTLRGGIFNYIGAGLTVDNGVVFNAAAGGFWQRQYTQSDGQNILWYGADPTGTNDNSAIIQDVLVNHSWRTNRIYFPSGTYLINETIGDANGAIDPEFNITNNIALIGYPGTILKANPTTEIHSMFALELENTNVTFEGITLDGNDKANRIIYMRRAGVPALDYEGDVNLQNLKILNVYGGANSVSTSVHGIYLQGKFNDVKISDIIIDGISGANLRSFGISVGGSEAPGSTVVVKDILIQDVTIKNATADYFKGIDMQYVSGSVRILDSNIQDITASNESFGIDIWLSNLAIIENNIILNVDGGTGAIGIKASYVNDAVITSNYISTVTDDVITRGIFFSYGGNAKISENTIHNIQSPDNGDGVHIVDSEKAILSNNIIGETSKRCLKVQSTTTFILNNYLYGNSTNDIYSFITLIGSDNSKISGNKIDDTMYKCEMGIIINGSKQVEVSKNTINGTFTSSAINVRNDLSPTTDLDISGNKINFLPSGVVTDGIYFRDWSTRPRISNNILTGDITGSVIYFNGRSVDALIYNNSYTDANLTLDSNYFVTQTNTSSTDRFVIYNNTFNSVTDAEMILPSNSNVTQWDNLVNGVLTPPLNTIKITEATLTPTQIQNSGTTPIELIPAPGVGKIIVVEKVVGFMEAGTTPYDDDGLSVKYGNDVPLVTFSTPFNGGGNDIYEQQEPSGNLQPNQPIQIGFNVNPTQGDAILHLKIYYRIVEF